ncbi:MULTISPECIES: AI-2E family transporter [unclassified Coleofasciculus]|uniref:AI-2E family transporter n=1 Tax=unclassified Coleofasciculus TaxID=2692782 RepID=UPI0018828FBB|nr:MULTISPECIES: AI-2E family transporter [unclassified Coleofasciculus]MBE9125010.1 AI-2E family transporter [Coleofasciculus sp. LEGE 07081]MBE9147670.1 AI-2E family transporter [Coleofasciculus sp. LEGE 07092]
MMESINKLPRQFSIGLMFPILFLNVWLLLLLARQLQPLSSILITATLIAFLLDYPIRFLHQQGVNRGIAAGLVFLLFLLILSTLVLFLGPLILQQANELLTRLPEWIKSGQQQLQSLESWAIAQQLPIDLSNTYNQLIGRLTSVLRSLTSQLISLIFNTIGSIVNVFLTLVFSIFLVLRGESLWNGILSWLPEQWNRQIRQSLPYNFERFIAGQVILATIIGVAQTTAQSILGIPLAELFGFGIGAASLIPFGGTTTIVVVSLLLSLNNFWLGVKVLVVAIAINQICENVLGPRIVGELTGLNPVWMLISLDLGVKLGGVLGLLVAVPIASFIKATFDTIRASTSRTQPTLITAEIAPDAEGSNQTQSSSYNSPN